ncbi:gastrula zinc finger protein XlCGF57.1-like [Ctenopharyngodon idella]|uniref:gastrula zinc finger protein XlCGF57.1-like n=1 Tax=Ctenopharyngodon idella TaxID=7959 RepID=UPI002230DD8E|nr:gastrula zinc finger protein XlCGF57.1-like [Ctenopharyngodon idella]
MSRKKCVFCCKGKTALFSFPKNPALREQWMQFVFPGQQRSCGSVFVCSRHFGDECFTNKAQFDAGFADRLKLKDGAVPAIKDPGHGSEPQAMLTMEAQMDVICCKSVGTDLSMLDIEDFISEICQLKKEVASLEAKLRERGDKPNREDSPWSVRNQRSRDTQESELSLTLLCYTDAPDHGSADQNFDCNSRGNKTTAEEQEQSHEEEKDEGNNEDDGNDDKEEDGNDDKEEFIPADDNSGSSSDGDEKTVSTSKDQLKVKTFSCSTCGKTLSSEGYLARHERKHIEERDFTCMICDISFPTLEERRLHTKEHNVKKEFCCEKCGKVFFITLYNMKAHMKRHTKPFRCSVCNKYFSTKHHLVVHKRTHTGERPYKCPQCERRFTYSVSLKAHVRVHTNERPYQCSECGKTFTNSTSLKSHQKIHSEEKPYKCSHCDKRFRKKSYLIYHERIHTGEKPFLCSYCGKSFFSPGEFGYHQRVHTGERPYHCSVCGKSFSKHGALKKHQRIHTGEKPYHCSICGERFAYLGSFQTHQKKHAKKQTAPESS